MKFDHDTQVRILTQVALHCPRKNLKGKSWVKKMVLPSHLKHGLRFDKVEDQVNIVFDGDILGHIKYKKGVYVGVYSLTSK